MQPLRAEPESTGSAASLRFSQSRWETDRTPAERNATPSVGLKWGSRKRNASLASTQSANRTSSDTWQNRNQRPPATVRVVGHQQSLDPFNDPFGDRLAQSGQTGPILTAAAQDRNSGFQPSAPQTSPDTGDPPSALPALPQTPALPDFADVLESPEPSETGPARESDMSTELVPLDEDFQFDDAAPIPPDDTFPIAKVDEEPCDRVYNKRNCCKESVKCKEAQQALYENSIASISLDITASFKPEAQNDEEKAKALDKQLSKMPPRTWRNRDGQVVAEGRVTNVHNRRLTIANESGSEQEVTLGDLSEDDWCFLAAYWEVPTECALGDVKYSSRTWEPMTFTWKASALGHKPLYFEEVQLERYGHTTGPIFQPVLSGAHFFANIAVLPYKMGINPPNECRYALGYYRPGSCAPWLVPPIPISLRGGLWEAGAVLGGVALFP